MTFGEASLGARLVPFAKGLAILTVASLIIFQIYKHIGVSRQELPVQPAVADELTEI